MGGKTSQSTQQVTIPPDVLARYDSVNAQAQKVAETPFQTYGGQFVAPTTPTQNAGIGLAGASATEAQPYYGAATNTLMNASGASDPYYGAATALAGASAGPVNAQQIGPQQIGQFLSPYLQTVLGSTAGLINQNNQQQQSGALGNAISQGAFGGDRAGIAAANLEQQQNLANANIYSNIANQGFSTALGAAQQQQGVDLSAGQANRAALAGAGQQFSNLGQTIYGQGANTATTLAGLGSGAQQAAQSGAASELAAGQVQQQTQQAQDTALYNQFLQQQSYPFQTAQFLANIAEGTGALSGSTTTTTTPGGLFSDRRLKEGVRKIGKTFDGQTIYSFRYKDDPHNLVRMGLMAQDVEKHHPDAVGLAGGFKTVDYGKATEDAADRGKFRRGGFAFGGQSTLPGVSPVDLAAILQAQEQSYAPYTQGGLYGGSASGLPHGGKSYVPEANLPVSHLSVAGGLAPQKNAAQNMSDWANLAKSGSSVVDGLKHAWGHHSGAEGVDKSIGDTDESMIPANDVNPVDGWGGSWRGGLRRAAGGLVGYADGGMPYSDQVDGPTLDIPNDPNQRQLAVAGGGSGGGNSTGSDIANLAKTVASVAKIAMMFERGGRVARASGGLAGRGHFDDGGDVGDDGDLLDEYGRNLKGGLGSAAALLSAAVRDGPAGLMRPTARSVTAALTSPEPSSPEPLYSDADVAAFNTPSAHHARSAGLAPTPANYDPLPQIEKDIAPQAALSGVIDDANAREPGRGLAPPSTPDGAVDIGSMNAPGLDPNGPSMPVAADAAAPQPTPGHGGGLGGATAAVGHGLADVGHALAPGGGFFDNLIHGKQSSVVPFLAAIGAMGAAQTKYPLIALTQGLGAGAQAYMGTQKAAADIAATQAQAGLTQTHRAILDFNSVVPPPGQMKVRADDPAHPPPRGVQVFRSADGVPYYFVPSIAGSDIGALDRNPTLGGAPTAGAAAAGAPAADGADGAAAPAAVPSAPVRTDEHTGATIYSPTAADDGAMAARNIQPGRTASAAAFIRQSLPWSPADQVREAASAQHAAEATANLGTAENLKRQMIQYITAFNSLPPGGFQSAGVGSEARNLWANLYRTGLQMVGQQPDESILDSASPNAIIEKMRQQLSVVTAAQNGERAAQIAHALASTLPGGETPPKAANEMFAQLLAPIQNGIDQARYANAWQDRYHTAYGWEDSFDRNFGGRQAQEVQKLPGLFARRNGKPSALERITENPSLRGPAERGGVDSHGRKRPGLGDGLLRYVGGS